MTRSECELRAGNKFTQMLDGFFTAPAFSDPVPKLHRGGKSPLAITPVDALKIDQQRRQSLQGPGGVAREPEVVSEDSRRATRPWM